MTQGSNDLHFFYDAQGKPAIVVFNGTPYSYVKNLQGDIIAILDSTGTVVVNYRYDAWGRPIKKEGSLAETLGTVQPFRYRGYVYDEETGFLYVSSRYYASEHCRWICSDDEMAEVAEEIRGYNLYSYCFNAPTNMSDSAGRWPKWLIGLGNAVSGTLQVVAGVALGATVGWTGIGAAAATVLIVNGSCQVTQGVGQIVNDVADSNLLREDNIARTGAQAVGQLIGGETGEKVACAAYDVTVCAANIYAGRVFLQRTGHLPVRVKTASLIPDPTNPMTDEGINYWTRTLSQNGYKGYNTLPNAYGNVEPIHVQIDTMIITNGHHRVQVLLEHGVETIKVYLTK